MIIPMQIDPAFFSQMQRRERERLRYRARRELFLWTPWMLFLAALNLYMGIAAPMRMDGVWGLMGVLNVLGAVPGCWIAAHATNSAVDNLRKAASL